MPRKENVEEHRGSTLRLPVSTRLVELRDAHRHVLWHRRGVLAIAMFFSATLLVQGTVAFYRLIVGLESRTDLIIFGSGLVIGLALSMSATDIPALAASSAARSRRPLLRYAPRACTCKIARVAATSIGLLSSRCASRRARSLSNCRRDQ